ncbi:hypothetical protein E2C01_031428 [Portunus trituberculatus]|uniref:Uncharacterized protein n=1 Tax=Portunus trituberculatus TaxID=210409 RepID=A0A5B7EYJ1_PORTR|nr:hypothetical protein [Portunus trituberculatus]
MQLKHVSDVWSPKGSEEYSETSSADKRHERGKQGLAEWVAVGRVTSGVTVSCGKRVWAGVWEGKGGGGLEALAPACNVVCQAGVAVAYMDQRRPVRSKGRGKRARYKHRQEDAVRAEAKGCSSACREEVKEHRTSEAWLKQRPASTERAGRRPEGTEQVGRGPEGTVQAVSRTGAH